MFIRTSTVVTLIGMPFYVSDYNLTSKPTFSNWFLIGFFIQNRMKFAWVNKDTCNRKKP